MNGQQEGGSGITQQGIMDSITLGQLRAMVGTVPKPKVCFFVILRVIPTNENCSNGGTITIMMMKIRS